MSSSPTRFRICKNLHFPRHTILFPTQRRIFVLHITPCLTAPHTPYLPTPTPQPQTHTLWPCLEHIAFQPFDPEQEFKQGGGVSAHADGHGDIVVIVIVLFLKQSKS